MSDDRLEKISEWRRRRRSGESVREIAEDADERVDYVRAAVYGQVSYHGPKEPPVVPEDAAACGEDSAAAKMTAEIVAWARRQKRGGATYSAILEEMEARWGVEVSKQALSKAVRGESWTHVDEETVKSYD